MRATTIGIDLAKHTFPLCAMNERGDETSREREVREAHRLFTEMGATGHAERAALELA